MGHQQGEAANFCGERTSPLLGRHGFLSHLLAKGGTGTPNLSLHHLPLLLIIIHAGERRWIIDRGFGFIPSQTV